MTDRRNRRRLQTFEELLAATRTLAQIEGWHGVTIRKIAAELGMTSAAIYRYVDSKDELVAELVRRGFSRLSDEMRVGAAAAPDPLVGAVEAYVSFARNDADLYQAMYGLAGADFAEATEEQGTRIGTIVASVTIRGSRVRPRRGGRADRSRR